MGCDGGTIPKRNEIVKNKRKDQARDKDADMSAKWQYCCLSGLELKKPIVACLLGRMYNKLAIVEYLLERQHVAAKNQASMAAASSNHHNDDPIAHIRCLGDIKELKLKERDDDHRKAGAAASSTADQFKVPFVCPISGLELSGKYKFYFSFACGCVFSERALKEVPNDGKCIICHQPYEPDMDLIVLNGDTHEIDELKRRISARRERTLAAKKARALEKASKKTHADSDSNSNSKRHKKSITVAR